MAIRDLNGTLAVTGDDAADELVNTDPAALLIAMLLDQQVPLEWAFAAPLRLRQRLGTLAPASLAAMDVENLVAAAVEKPAIHRFPASMARRIHALSAHLAEHYPTDPADLWNDAANGTDLARRLMALPGFGPEKTKIMIAILAKRFGVAPDGWEAAAGVFADDEPRSAADASDPESMAAVRTWKAAQKAAGLDKQGRPLSDP